MHKKYIVYFDCGVNPFTAGTVVYAVDAQAAQIAFEILHPDLIYLYAQEDGERNEPE